jgi:hypothetical protein
MPKEYVYMGAALKCPFGSAESKLMMTPQHRVQSGGKMKANIGDAKPFVNIMPFGTCKSMANPTVAAATAAAQGVLQQMPCTPVCTVWIGGKTNVLLDGMPALMKNDKLLCSFGQGMIEIKDSGQGASSPASPQLSADGMSGPVEVKPPPNATPEQIEQTKKYVEGSNKALKDGALSPTGRVSTKGDLRADASLSAAQERARAAAAKTPYSGHAGHVPDTTWTGKADPHSWLDLDPAVNTSIGGQAKRYPIGFKPTEFIFKGGN